MENSVYLESPFFVVLVIATGIFWILTYVSCVYTNYRKKTCLMPLFPLMLNLVWELLYTVFEFISGGHGLAVKAILVLWAGLDIAIAVSYFKFTRPLSVPKAGLAFGFAIVFQVAFLLIFGTSVGVRYSAFLQELIAAVLFVYEAKKLKKPYPMIFPVSKLIGDLCPTILMGFLTFDPFIAVTGVLALGFNSYFVYQCAKRR